MSKKLIAIFLLFNLQSLICNLESFAQTWSEVGGGLSPSTSRVDAIHVYKNELYVGGGFGTAGGINAVSIARWDGTNWDSVGSGMIGSVKCFAIYNDTLYVGGSFGIVGGIPNTALIAKWDGTNWSEVGGGAVYGAVLEINALAVYKGELYAAGKYNSIGGISVNRIARWDGSSWKDVGGGGSGCLRKVS